MGLLELWRLPAIPNWFLVSIIMLFAYYRHYVWHYGIFKRLGIKGPRPYPMFGTMLLMMQKGVAQHDLYLKKYGKYVGYFQVGKPFLMIYDTQVLKQILVKDFSNFTNRFDLNINSYPMEKMVIQLKDEHWKHVRNHLTPAFSGGKLRKMNGKILQCTETLSKNLEKKAETKEIFDFRDLCGAYTMDVIASTAFGVKIDSHNDPNNQFVQMGKKAFNLGFTNIRTWIFFVFPTLAKFLSKFGFSIFPKDVIEFFGATVEQAMAQRHSSNKDDVDFLQLMVNAHVDDDYDEEYNQNAEADRSHSKKEGWTNSEGLSHEEVLAQGILFFLSGYETIANPLSLIGYELAVHPEIQERLVKEVDAVMKDQKQVTFELVQKMPYLEMCLSEVLRLYPPGPRTDRVTRNNVVINDLFIPKGMNISIPIYALQNDPEVWPNPEKFDPERFTPEAKESRDPLNFIPFGFGPRNCVGMRLALMELKMSIVYILQRFKFDVCEETQIPLKVNKLRMQGENGIKLRVEKRM